MKFWSSLGIGLAGVVVFSGFTLAYHLGVRDSVTCADWDRSGYWIDESEDPHVSARMVADFIKDCLDSGQVDVNQTDWRGQTLLHRVIKSNNRDAFPERFEIAKVLVAEKDQYGLDLEATDDKGRTALYYATGKLTRMPFALLLLEAGADVATTGSEERRAHASTYAEVFSQTVQALRNPLKEDVADCADMACLVDILVKN